jgi:hypothetical protein
MVGGFLRILRLLLKLKLVRHDIAEILLKVALKQPGPYMLNEEFEDTEGVIRIRISKKNRKHNGQMT